jgi:hypothetical protein
VLGAYARYAGQLVPEVFSRYLDDALDLDTHASYGRLLVAATPERVLGFAVFYPDSWPDSGPVWLASVRVLPSTRARTGRCPRPAGRASAWPPRPGRRCSRSARPAS